MRRLLLILLLFFSLTGLLAQEKHFVFIQSDNSQPFYVSLKGKLYSSSATGYIIIPKLAAGDYSFSIGFAKNAFPEQAFRFFINNRDLGYNLKNFGEKGWGLFNLQSLDVVMSESTSSDNIGRALREKEVAKDESDPIISFNRNKQNTPSYNKMKEDTVATEVATNKKDRAADEPIAKNEGSEDQPATQINVVSEEANSKNEDVTNNIAGFDGDVKKVSESKEADGLHLAYQEGEGEKDTINVIIPSSRAIVETESNDNSSESDSTTSNDTVSSPDDRVVTETIEASQDSLNFLDINSNKSGENVAKEESGAPKNVRTVVINTKCKNIATSDDYTRIRRKMARETTDGKMIDVARKMYRNKCFTTSQIKRLSTLFLSDEGRYNFFKASYNSVSDVAEYSALQSEFVDPAFTNRFNALLN